MPQSEVPASHIRSSENFPCCSGRLPCRPASILSVSRNAHGWSAYPPASVSDDTRLSDRSTPELPRSPPVPRRSPDRTPGTRSRHTCVPALSLYPQCSPSFPSEILWGRDRLFPFPCHVQPPRMHSVYVCCLSQRAAPHFSPASDPPARLFSSSLSGQRQDPEDK